MVSPKLLRKVDRGKVNKIVRNATKPSTENKSELVSSPSTIVNPGEVNKIVRKAARPSTKNRSGLISSPSIVVNAESTRSGSRNTKPTPSWEEVEPDVNILSSLHSNTNTHGYTNTHESTRCGSRSTKPTPSLKELEGDVDFLSSLHSYTNTHGSSKSSRSLGSGFEPTMPSTSTGIGFQPTMPFTYTGILNDFQFHGTETATQFHPLDGIQSRSIASPTMANNNGDPQNRESTCDGSQSARRTRSWKEVEPDVNILSSLRSNTIAHGSSRPSSSSLSGFQPTMPSPSTEIQSTNGIQSPTPANDTGRLQNRGISKPKRKRGKTRGHKLAKLTEGGIRLEVLFPAHVNRPVGTHSTLFTTEIGILVRQNAPLQAETWKAVSNEKKNIIMDLLRDKFIFGNEPRVVESVAKMMETRYNSWRYRIHLKFLSYRTLAAALSNRPPFELKQPDWIYLCNLFNTQKFKARSKRGKENKKELKVTHTVGTKAYSKIRFDKRNSVTQTELGLIDLYVTAHVTSEGSWVNEDAIKYHMLIGKVLLNVTNRNEVKSLDTWRGKLKSLSILESMKQHKANAELEGIDLTDEQLSVLTFGRKSGYICGLGRGPKPATSASGKRTRAELEQEAYEATKRAEMAERAVAEARKENALMNERVKALEAQQADFSAQQAAFSAKLREEMSMQFGLMHQQLLRKYGVSKEN